MVRIPGIDYVNVPATDYGRPAAQGDFGGGQGTRALAEEFNRSSEIAIRMADVSQSATARDNIKEARSALTASLTEELNNPDYNGRAERFGAVVDKVRTQSTSGLFPRYADHVTSSVDLDVSQHASRLSLQHRKDTIQHGRRTLTETLLDNAQAASLLPPGVPRDTINTQSYTDIEQGQNQGIVNPMEAHKWRVDYDDDVLSREINRRIAEDPRTVLAELSDPESRYSKKMSMAAVSAAENKAVRRLELNLRRQEQDDRRATQKQEKEDKKLGAIAESNADIALDDGDTAMAQELLDKHGAAGDNTMDTDAQRRIRARVRTGGGLEDRTVRDVYQELEEYIEMGEADRLETFPEVFMPTPGERLTLPDVIRQRFSSGALLKADRDELLDREKDRRFGAAEQYMTEALKPGVLADSIFVATAASAKKQFRQWQRENPDASHPEAMKMAEFYTKQAATFHAGKQVQLALPFTRNFIVKDAQGNMDLDASVKKAHVAWKLKSGSFGGLGDTEALQQLRSMVEALKVMAQVDEEKGGSTSGRDQ